jgi:hypothetical protein
MCPMGNWYSLPLRSLVHWTDRTVPLHRQYRPSPRSVLLWHSNGLKDRTEQGRSRGRRNQQGTTNKWHSMWRAQQRCSDQRGKQWGCRAIRRRIQQGSPLRRCCRKDSTSPMRKESAPPWKDRYTRVHMVHRWHAKSRRTLRRFCCRHRELSTAGNMHHTHATA